MIIKRKINLKLWMKSNKIILMKLFRQKNRIINKKIRRNFTLSKPEVRKKKKQTKKPFLSQIKFKNTKI